MTDRSTVSREEHPIDEATLKLGLAEAILNALHEQHCSLNEPPSIRQSDIEGMLYAAMMFVEQAHSAIRSMQYVPIKDCRKAA